MTIIQFKDLETEEIHYGILLFDGQILCACCGGTYEQGEYTILDKYTDDFEEEIREMGGWL